MSTTVHEPLTSRRKGNTRYHWARNPLVFLYYLYSRSYALFIVDLRFIVTSQVEGCRSMEAKFFFHHYWRSHKSRNLGHLALFASIKLIVFDIQFELIVFFLFETLLYSGRRGIHNQLRGMNHDNCSIIYSKQSKNHIQHKMA